MTSFVTEALSREHDRKAFRSGAEPLDRYLGEFALQDIPGQTRRLFLPVATALRNWETKAGSALSS